jgi:hypothetical protein
MDNFTFLSFLSSKEFLQKDREKKGNYLVIIVNVQLLLNVFTTGFTDCPEKVRTSKSHNPVGLYVLLNG